MKRIFISLLSAASLMIGLGSAFGESGICAYRACRSVATWSMFTPSTKAMAVLNAGTAGDR